MTTELKLVTTQSATVAAIGDQQPDYFTRRDGVLCAGVHLLLELWQAHRLDDVRHIQDTLRRAAEACGATLLHVHCHHFTEGGGVSGIAVLAESHISIHTWPERGYAAMDIFMCGSCNPYDALPVIKKALSPGSVQLSENKRGVVP
ncbi:MAG: adenosylmethionine decarboxylase [Alphaproteobacteria bacterium]